MPDDRVYVRVPIKDELTGLVDLLFSLKEEDVSKVLSWGPGVAKLYLGETGVIVQGALRELDPEG
ncbi:hypothetical protein [Streptomyces sp. S1]|uniref:hypothetical protein n=1 Tax=Streptomyces sp. S1 TaxID=718288 RepID=UPI003D7608A4